MFIVDEIRVIPDMFGLATVGPRPYLPREFEKMGGYGER